MRVMFIAGAVAGALVVAAAAEAKVAIITYTGSVDRSEDTTGVFGGSGNSLDTLPFELVYKLTYPIAGAYTSKFDTYSTYIGGQTFGAPSIQSATLTINGVSRDFAGTYQSSVTYYDQAAGYYDQISHEAQDYVPSSRNHFVQAGIGSNLGDIIDTTDFLAPLDYTFKSGDVGLGSFYWSDTDPASGKSRALAYGNFNYTGVTVVPNAVPEPATWMLLIVGFGAVGLAMRTRRRAVPRPQMA